MSRTGALRELLGAVATRYDAESARPDYSRHRRPMAEIGHHGNW
jgi:hypothetical protein